MRYPADHKEKTRELVLVEAAKAIRASGPSGVSVADVMKRAGLTHGGFYAHFESKDAMLAAAIDKMFTASRARLAGTLDEYIAFYLSDAHRDAVDTGCPIAALAADQPRMSDPCREAFAAGARRLHVRVTEWLGGDETLAASVVAELVGALSLARIEPDAARSHKLLTASKQALKARLAARQSS